jgi:hypothetical protein
MGQLGNRQQPACKRGHRLEGKNAMPHSNGGRRCRACNRALTAADNLLNRKGISLTPAEVDALADEKYQALYAVGL